MLLAEGSVAAAARRLRLSPSAMSRTLARLRAATGDPLLVRAGRGLVPTPRALELRQQTGGLVEAVLAALRPAEALDPGRLDLTFTLAVSDGFVDNFGPALVARIQSQAPGIRLRFVAKDRDGGALRRGEVDAETGVVKAHSHPELRAQALFHDRFVGVVRHDHPLLSGTLTPARLAAARHVAVCGQGQVNGPVEEALGGLGLDCVAAVVVGGFAAALALVRASDLVATVPERHSGNLRDGLVSFVPPLDLPPITVSLLWHPRLDADPAHRWLRGCVREVCLDAVRTPAGR